MQLFSAHLQETPVSLSVVSLCCFWGRRELALPASWEVNGCWTARPKPPCCRTHQATPTHFKTSSNMQLLTAPSVARLGYYSSLRTSQNIKDSEKKGSVRFLTRRKEQALINAAAISALLQLIPLMPAAQSYGGTFGTFSIKQ